MQNANCKLRISKRAFAAAFVSIAPTKTWRPFFNLQLAICKLQFAMVLLLNLMPHSLHAAAIDPPLIGRPVHAPFSGAVGSFYPSTRAAPTELQANDALTFTIRLTADGQVRSRRIDRTWRELPVRRPLLHRGRGDS